VKSRFIQLGLGALATAMACICLPVSAQAAESTTVRVVRNPQPLVAAGFYTPNRAPLQPTAFMKLPIGNITPKGWLRHQLELDADGLSGRLEEISDYLKFENTGWVDPKKSGWEEATYWLRGYGDLGYVLKDPKIIAEARKWIDAVIATQQPDGYFGPQEIKPQPGKRDLPDPWPHMPMLDAMHSYYDFSGDQRVLRFMSNYFKWVDAQPSSFFNTGWGAVRWADNMANIYWLYNLTGENWLLDLAKKIHYNSPDYTGKLPTMHNVNLSQGIREPAEFWLQEKTPKYLSGTEQDYHLVMDNYGQFPGGGFAGDENIRPAFRDPRQGFETCGIVEFMHTFEMMTHISSDPLWADRCEELAFNSLPAALPPDHKGTHYITCANSIQLDNNSKKHQQFSNGPFPMQAFKPGVHDYRCCPHNYGMGWPYYAEELWLATADNGLCASLYAASDVKAKVASGTEVSISEETDYPFSDTIQFRINTPQAVSFPLYLRVPRWTQHPVLRINGKVAQANAEPLSYIVVDRAWHNGDVVSLQLPMHIVVRTWTKNKNSVSVDYGPLTFSMAMGEKWSRYGGSDAWPEWAVLPTSAWNYGLELNTQNPAAAFEVVRKNGPLAAQPFTPDAVPVALKARARKIPGWQADPDNVVSLLQQSPVRSEEPLETVTLIPMGAARLRITSFPTIGHGDNAHEWLPPATAKGPQPSASFVHDGDTVDALNDGMEPAASSDESVPRFTWWDHKGTPEWVQYDFKQPTPVASVSVYWFDDTGKGGCRVPKSWRLLYKDGDNWKPVENASAYDTARDRYNQVTFKPVTTSALRLEVQLQDGFSGGILEWKVGSAK